MPGRLPVNQPKPEWDCRFMLIGANPEKERDHFRPRIAAQCGSIFCAVRSFPPAVSLQPRRLTGTVQKSHALQSAVARRPQSRRRIMLPRTTMDADGPSNARPVARGEILHHLPRGPEYTSPPGAPRRETALIICRGVTPTSWPIEIRAGSKMEPPVLQRCNSPAAFSRQVTL